MRTVLANPTPRRSLWSSVAVVCFVAAAFAGCYPDPEDQFYDYAGATRGAAADSAAAPETTPPPADGGTPGTPAGDAEDAAAGSDWPVAIDSLWDRVGGCQVPACDEDSESGFVLAGGWQRTLTTTATTCSAMIGQADPRATVGNVQIEDLPPFATLAGTCGYDDEGTHTATVHDGALVTCESNEQLLGVISWETAVLTLDGEVASGPARIFLTNVPDIAGGDCDIELLVEFRRP